MKTKLSLLALLVSTILFAQNGINYKAIIKDANGNVVANDLIQVQFSILQGVAQTNVYQETHTPTTDTNGLIILNIGEGTTPDDFNSINWSNDDHFLNVQVNIGSGLVDLGTTSFGTVPYAMHTLNPQGLEAINEGNGVGWRIATGADEDYYGDIGAQAVDLSFQGFSSNRGATGLYSFASGAATIANAPYSVVFGEGSNSLGRSSFSLGRYATASGDYSTAMGESTQASGSYSFAIGNDTEASGNYSTAIGLANEALADFAHTIGRGLITDSYSSFIIGHYNLNYGGLNSAEWIPYDPLFVIGNGFNDSNRSNALIVYKNGSMNINSSTNGLRINSNGSDGIRILGDNDNGILVTSANQYGGSFIGDSAAIFAEANINANPDIILGGDSGGNTMDDGIIASDPSLDGSDIYLRSNDAVVIELDHDASSTNSSFQVHDSSGDAVFQVFESGNHIIDSEVIGLNIISEYIGLYIPNSGNEAIFINNPGSNGIQISSPTNAGVVITSPGNSGLYVVNAGDFGADIEGDTAGLAVSSSTSSNPDIILRGNSSANTSDDGIIASDPNYSGSDIYLRSNDAVVIELDHDASTANSSFQVHDSAGNVAFRVYEDGNANLAGNLTQFSDRRLKQDIADLHYGLNEILQLQPKAYHWKKNKQEHKSLGLIAQDVQLIINEIVNTQNDESKTLGISYIELIPILINAIKEQQKIIDNEKSINSKQNSQLEALLSRIEILESNASN
ncbi:tail fiber domain-containing protein [Psychroserpens ponticola]|uniref:Tail fiber domain-containing protein n=1 Tax=Psychroserpens ponticola TaxID=2932268 RepID=A0ABY7RXI4_9FLAO|nr:tail fiber domain-containing protein [Psychroserpens ponticola]WCO01743.1 tail fiber domain-containing protein [Psychroserpens ponticola]